MAENYPFEIAVGQNYSVYLGVTNHMGSLEYYLLKVKLANLADPLPNSTVGVSSPVQSLYEYKFLISDSQTWESSLTFAINTASTSVNQATINNITLNNSVFNVNKLAVWNSTNHEYSYRLIFELWMYNSQSNVMQFNNRFADLQLNLTKTNP